MWQLRAVLGLSPYPTPADSVAALALLPLWLGSRLGGTILTTPGLRISEGLC